MFQILLVIHLIVTCALVGIVLIQRSEGGGLGSVAGSGNMGANAPRAKADILTRTTGILAAIFMVTSLSLVIITTHNNGSVGLVEQLQGQATPGQTNPLAPNSPGNAPVDQKGATDNNPLTSNAPAQTQSEHAPTVPLAK